MHLIGLVESPGHVCCRYRLAAFRSHLEEAGHRLELRSIPRHAWSWFSFVRALPQDSILIIQRKFLRPWQLFLLGRGGRKLVFDVDDAVYLRDSYSPKGFEHPARRRAFARMMRAVDAVAAGNRFLAEEARHCNAPGVTIIPTCVNVTAYPAAEHRREGNAELVWIGSSSTLQGLERIRPMLDGIGRRNRGVRLKLVCDRFIELAELPVVPCRWSEANEASELASADIGIGWVPDDPWSRGKCALKLLQYMAAGLPVVANPVGVQATIVHHGENGYLAETPEQWLDAIGRLVNDAALRQRMGEAGRRLVERDYSLAAGASKWHALLDRLRSARRVA